jgi:Ca-activated chloride channel homolog
MVAAPGAAAQTSDLATPHSSLEIVLDSSKSMGRARLAAARSAIVQAAHALPPGTPVGLRLYGSKSSSCSDSRAVVPVGAASSSVMRSALKDVKPTGVTPVALAVARASKDLPAVGERTVVLVAGGPDSCAPPPPCQTTSSPSVRVDVIGLQVNAAARRGLQCTARASGGVYRDAATPTALLPELETALARAARDRRSLGKPIAGGLEESQATPVAAGEYLDSIAPDSERWYRVPIPPGHVLTAAATLVAPPSGDVSAPGSSLTLDAFGGGGQTDTASNPPRDRPRGRWSIRRPAM